MDVSVEAQLRGWIEYLRELRVHDLYRREEPTRVLSSEVRQAFAAAAAKRLTASSASGVSPRRDEAQRSVSSNATVTRSTVGTPVAPPTSTVRSRPSQGEQSEPHPVAAYTSAPARAPEPAVSYFATDATAATSTGTLPPELAPPMPKPKSFDELAPIPAEVLSPAERPAALALLRAEIGDCTRCPLAYAGRHTIVFRDGDPASRLMFIGEGPGADEDASGLPFVGKAGQLLNNMINAMGLQREQVYIANIVMCRPPANRAPEFIEATTCSQFLLRQIDIIKPQVIVALGATAATYLLGVRQSLASLRGQWHTARGAKVAVTYHPAFLLRDPRQKGEAWKDLQRVMAELDLAPPRKAS